MLPGQGLPKQRGVLADKLWRQACLQLQRFPFCGSELIRRYAQGNTDTGTDEELLGVIPLTGKHDLITGGQVSRSEHFHRGIPDNPGTFIIPIRDFVCCVTAEQSVAFFLCLMDHCGKTEYLIGAKSLDTGIPDVQSYDVLVWDRGVFAVDRDGPRRKILRAQTHHLLCEFVRELIMKVFRNGTTEQWFRG